MRTRQNSCPRAKKSAAPYYTVRRYFLHIVLHELGHALETVDVAKLTLLDAPQTEKLDYAEGGLNPHAWLLPANALVWTDLIAARLSEIDPEHAATYAANAAASKAAIIALDGALATELMSMMSSVSSMISYSSSRLAISVIWATESHCGMLW